MRLFIYIFLIFIVISCKSDTDLIPEYVINEVPLSVIDSIELNKKNIKKSLENPK